MVAELRRLAVKAYLRRLSLDGKPILVGPWRSEVGFEALYWLPFLRWACTKCGIDAKRMVVVSRGGAGALYGPFPVNADVQSWPDRSIDLYSLCSVRDVSEENIYDSLRTKVQKQIRCTAWDRTVLREAAERVLGKGARYHILHPSWMYWALAPFWEEQRGLGYLLSMADYTTLLKPQMPMATYETYGPNEDGSTTAQAPWMDLPERFVAVKFYRREPTFPLSADTIPFVQHVVSTLAQQTHVVLLNSDHGGDDHSDIIVKGPNILALPQVPPEQNLALQAAVLGKATAFVGTYGGVAQLALRMGIPSVSFYTTFNGTASAHLSLSNFLSQRTGVPFVATSIRDCDLLKQVVVAPMKEKAA